MSKNNTTVPGIEVTIPGWRKPLRIKRVVFDFNGTLAVDGKLIRGVAVRLKRLAKHISVVVLTADTFGTVRQTFKELPVTVHIVNNGMEKRTFVESVPAEVVAAIGNGDNDIPMLKAAKLGIAILGKEGTSGELITVATVVVSHINDAFDLLLSPRRLMATLRK